MHINKHIALALFLFVMGCSGSNANKEKFIGLWERVNSQYSGRIEIQENGDSLLFIGLNKDGSDEKYSATVDDQGNLNVSGPFGDVVYTYIEESDILTGIGKEYKRVE